MYNTDLPNRADLPSSAQLKRSTIIAAAAAVILLVTVVMPSEYGIDPTRMGRLLGLTTMGEIKTQLAAEAAADAAGQSTPTSPRPSAVSPELSARLERIEGLLVSLTAQQPALPADAPSQQNVVAAITPPEEEPVQEPTVAAPEAAAPAIGRADEMTFTLTPGQGVEVKLVMRQGQRQTLPGQSKAAWSTSTPMATAAVGPSATKRAAAFHPTRVNSKPHLMATTAGSGAIAGIPT